MRHNKSRKFGIIISSCAISEIVAPYLSVYTASKKYIDTFSRSLDIELNSQIDFLVAKPLKVNTNLLRNYKVENENEIRYENVNYGLDVQKYVSNSLN